MFNGCFEYDKEFESIIYINFPSNLPCPLKKSTWVATKSHIELNRPALSGNRDIIFSSMDQTAHAMYAL